MASDAAPDAGTGEPLTPPTMETVELDDGTTFRVHPDDAAAFRAAHGLDTKGRKTKAADEDADTEAAPPAANKKRTTK